MSNLVQLQKLCEQWLATEQPSEEGFAKIVRIYLQLKFPVGPLGEKFGANPQTVLAWAQGTSRPSFKHRTKIVRWISQRPRLEAAAEPEAAPGTVDN